MANYYTSSRSEAYKREKEKNRYTVGSSGTSATAQARDARRNATLGEMGITTTNTTPKTTTPRSTANNSGYAQTYGSNTLYTSAGNTGQSLGGSAGSTVPSSSGRNYGGKAAGANTNYSGGIAGSAHYRTGMSDHDIQVRQEYNRKRANAAQQDAWAALKEEGQTQQILQKEQQEQSNDYADMIRSADEAGYALSSQHLRDMRRELDDMQARIDLSADRLIDRRKAFEDTHQTYTGGTWAAETEPMTMPETAEETNIKIGVVDLEIAALKAQLGDTVSYEDIAGLSRDEYLVSNQKNLEERQKIEAKILQLMWERKRLETQKNVTKPNVSNSADGQAKTILYDGAMEDSLYRDYWFSQKDPTTERKSDMLTREEQLNSFRENNYETLYGDSVFGDFLRNHIHDTPGDIKNWFAEQAGKAAGKIVSAGNDSAGEIGETVAGGIDTYRVAFGKAYRGFLLSGVDEETAQKAAKDEAIIVACVNGLGGIAVDALADGIEDPVVKVAAKVGIEEIMKLPVNTLEEIIAEENRNRIFSGDTAGGVLDLLECVIIHGLLTRGFDEE